MATKDGPTLLDRDIHEVEIAFRRGEDLRKRPLNIAQQKLIPRLHAMHHPSLRNGRTRFDEGLVIAAPGTGKTGIFIALAIDGLEEEGLPSLFSVDSTELMSDMEQAYREAYEDYFGDTPIIWRYGVGGHIDEGEPHLIMATPTLLQQHVHYEGNDHPILDRKYAVGGFDEGDQFVTPDREEIVHRVSARRKIIVAGFPHRLDDPKDSHRIEKAFGQRLANVTYEDARNWGLINEPRIIQYATDIEARYHDILGGRLKRREIDLVVTSPEFNRVRVEVLIKHWHAQGRRKLISYWRSIEQAEDIAKFMREEYGLDPLLIHSKTDHEANKEEFFRRPDGIAVCVDKMRRGINIHEDGLLIMENAHTTSIQKTLQTAGRGVRAKNVLILDFTNNMAEVSHFHINPVSNNAYVRRVDRETLESTSISVGNVQVHSSVDRFAYPLYQEADYEGIDTSHIKSLRELIEVSKAREKFFFALEAHAASIWLNRSEADRTNRNVSLEPGSKIFVTENLTVTLTRPENINIQTWFNRLSRTPHGDYDLSPRQQAVLDHLGIDLQKIKEHFDSERINKPSVKRTKSEEFFESDEFWLGLEAFRELNDSSGIHDSIMIQAFFDIPFTLARGKAPKRFIPIGEPPSDTEDFVTTDQPVDLTAWKKNVTKYFNRAPVDIQISLIKQGIIFYDTNAFEAVVRSHTDPRISRKSSPNSPEQVWNVDDEKLAFTIKAGSQIIGPRDLLIELPMDVSIRYQNYLQTRYVMISLDFLYFTGLRMKPGPTLLNIETRALRAETFINGLYFQLAAEAKRISQGRVDQPDIVTIPSGTQILLGTNTPGQPELVRVNSDIPLVLSLFRQHLKQHIRYLSPQDREYVSQYFPEVIGKNNRSTLVEHTGSKGMNGIPGILYHAHKHELETTLFRLWMGNSPTDLSVPSFQEALQDAVPEISTDFDLEGALNRCRFLVYRYMILEGQKSPSNSSKDMGASLLLGKLKDLGWKQEDLIDGVRIDTEKLQGNLPLDTAGKRLFYSIPEERRFDFFISMLKDPIHQEIIGFPGFIPEFVEEHNVDPKLLELLVSIEAERQYLLTSSLEENGFIPIDTMKDGMYLPKGTEILLPDGQALHLAKDTPYSHAYFDDILKLFTQDTQYPGTTETDEFIWQRIDASGYTQMYHPEARLILNAMVFAQWLQKEPDDYSFNKSPRRNTVPAGTEITLSNGRVITLAFPQRCDYSIDLCRNLAIRYMLSINKKAITDLLKRLTPVGADLPRFSLGELLNETFNMGVYEETDFIPFGKYILDALPEDCVEEFLSGCFNDLEDWITEPYENDPKVAQEKLEMRLIDVDVFMRHSVFLQSPILKGNQPALPSRSQDR